MIGGGLVGGPAEITILTIVVYIKHPVVVVVKILGVVLAAVRVMIVGGLIGDPAEVTLRAEVRSQVGYGVVVVIKVFVCILAAVGQEAPGAATSAPIAPPPPGRFLLLDMARCRRTTSRWESKRGTCSSRPPR